MNKVLTQSTVKTDKILLTFHGDARRVVVLSFGVHSLTLIGARIVKLYVIEVQMSPRHAQLVSGW